MLGFALFHADVGCATIFLIFIPGIESAYIIKDSAVLALPLSLKSISIKSIIASLNFSLCSFQATLP